MINQSDQQSVILQTLEDYYQAFNTLDPSAVLPYFNEPAMLISSPGAFAAPTHAVLVKIFASIMAPFRATDFGRTELAMPTVTRLSAATAMITDTAIRYKRDGQEMNKAGATCVLQKTNAGWRIAVAVAYDVLVKT